jgi:hypothetical protein
MSSTNDLTTIPDDTAYRVKKRVSKEKDKQRNTEVALTAAAATALASAVGMTAARKLKGTRKAPDIQLEKAKKMSRISRLLDDPDVPLPRDLEEQYSKSRKARNAISGYKKDRIKLLRSAEKSAEVYGHDYGMTPNQAKKYYTGSKLERKTKQGVDAMGHISEGMFVKEAKPDSIYRGDVSPSYRKRNQMVRKKSNPISKTRKNMMNRVILQEGLGDLGADTFFYRKKKGSPVTIAQELLSVGLQGDNYLESKINFLKDREELRKKADKLGIDLRDLHDDNIGYTPAGKAKVVDVGHSRFKADYEGMVTNKKLKKAVEKTKNVMSPMNKRLYIKKAKQFAKRLPMIGGLITAGGILTAPNKAEAAIEEGIDTASMGLLTPDTNVGGDLPPEVLRKQQAHNRLMQLEQLKQNRKR